MNLPTADEFLFSHGSDIHSMGNDENKICYCVITPKELIEFAKLHVEKALKEALESIPCLGSSTDIPTYEEVEQAVLNAYPLTLIK